MKRLMINLASVVGLLLVSISGYAAQYLVKYNDRATLNALKAQSLELNMNILSRHAPGKYVVVDIDKATLPMTMLKLYSNPNIEWVVPNFKLSKFEAPAEETEFQSLRPQWAIEKVKAVPAWERAVNKGRKNIILAVIDTGVDYRHPNLAPNMVAGYDFRDNDSDPMDDTSSKNPGHGTHCAGIAAATGLVDGGITGSSPEVSIMPIRFLGADGSGDLNGGIRSIDYAIEKGAHVISASWGATVPRANAAALIEAVKRADDRGVIFVAAAANDGRNNDTTDVYPANAGFPNTISVAASGSSDAKPQWSNYGKATVHIAAPGEKIMSTLPGNKYGDLSGTSMATPLVSGAVAFLKAQDPSLTGAEIRALLQVTGAKVAIETSCNCRLDLFAATDHLLAKKLWMVPAAGTYAPNTTFNITVKNGQAPFKFASSNTGVLTVTDAGAATAVADGTATVSVTDAAGVVVTSLEYHVGAAKTAPPGGDCPLGDPMLCEILCGIMPEAPFCQ